MKIYRENNPEPVKKKRGRPKGYSTKNNTARGTPQRKYIKIRRFVKEYLIDMNGKAAYQRCGYGSGNEMTDGVAASKLLDRDEVIQLISEEEERRSKTVNITQEMVLRELAILAFADLSKITTWDGQSFALKPFAELTRDQIALISSIKVMPRQFGGIDLEFKTPSASDKKAALETVGRHLGMFWEGERQGDPVEAARKIREALNQIEEKTAV